MKTKIAVGVAILFLFLLVIQSFRYEMYISADGETVMRLDESLAELGGVGRLLKPS
jgi:hypothetical protein